MRVIAIAAVARNGVIGNEGKLPWELPEDMRFFRDSTRGQVVVMGRKTYDSLGKALPKRENAVITRNLGFQPPDARVFYSLEEAIRHFLGREDLRDHDLFVIGGSEIYALSKPLLDEIWLTEIDADFSGDAVFPGYSDGILRDPGFSIRETRAQVEYPASGLRYSFKFYSRT
jgi:dihydrofolate reductase